MPVFEDNAIAALAIHHVGNKAAMEPLVHSNGPTPLGEALSTSLLQYFIEPFKVREYYHLYHPDGLEHNEVYRLAEALFDDPESLYDVSLQLAQVLYDACTHPNIKGGDLFVAYFRECQFEGQAVDAIGLFKAETQTEYLKVQHDAECLFSLNADRGIDMHKLDKGAIIFHTEDDRGYVVSVVDNAGRGSDAAYWRDQFLGLLQRQDEFYNTHAELAAYKKFITDELPQQFDGVSRADQADLLGKSVDFFKQNDRFDLDTFSDEVIRQPEVIESFKQYRQQYQQDNQVELSDDFAISDEAVKKQARVMRSVIKLDKNFHIYVHGNRQMIEQGEDEKGKYYKMYYKEES